MEPIISWYIQDDNEYAQYDNYYLGAFNYQEKIILNIQVWNNRYGEDEVDSIDNAKLLLYFNNAEDVFILNYCKIYVEGTLIKPTIEIDRGYAYIWKLSGSINDGSDTTKNKNNFKDIQIVFSNLPANLRQGLKEMFLDIQAN